MCVTPKNLWRSGGNCRRIFGVRARSGHGRRGIFGEVWEFAEECLEICEEHDIADFDIAFAYEAMARANAVAGNTADCQKYLELAKKAGDAIKDDGDKQYFLGELGAIACEEQ